MTKGFNIDRFARVVNSGNPHVDTAADKASPAKSFGDMSASEKKDFRARAAYKLAGKMARAYDHWTSEMAGTRLEAAEEILTNVQQHEWRQDCDETASRLILKEAAKMFGVAYKSASGIDGSVSEALRNNKYGFMKTNYR